MFLVAEDLDDLAFVIVTRDFIWRNDHQPFSFSDFIHYKNTTLFYKAVKKIFSDEGIPKA